MEQLAIQVIKELERLKNPKKAKDLAWFFKTGKGQYGEGDIFWGIVVPLQRKVAREFYDLSLGEVAHLLKSPVHEQRLTGLLILVKQFQKGDARQREQIFNFYLKNAKRINNWDLVDLSCRDIVGQYLIGKDKAILYEMVKSKNLWARRIATVSTSAFIRNGDTKETYKIAQMLLREEHDLIHKASGWMLREAGKVDRQGLEKFLVKFSKKMPRTMLRYSLEHFSPPQRKKYMEK
ncbi:MAG: DNA alkylation repair protein [Candidatus Paceibacterota bacterium]